MSLKDIVALEKIYNDFHKETQMIRDYIDFMEKSVVLNGLKTNKTSSYVFSHNFDTDDIKNIQSKIDIIKKKNLEDISNTRNKIEKEELLEIPEWFTSIDSRSEEGELVNYIFECIENDTTDRNDIFKDVETQLEALCIMEGENIGGEFYIGLYDDKARIYEYIDCSLKAYHNNLIFEDKQHLEILINYEKLLRLVDVKNNINIYRQAFIQLVALFDAFVFECFEVQFSNDFFRWIRLFGKDSISLNDIANNDSFDDLKSMIIEKELKGLYLKDLLITLKEESSSVFNIDSKSKYAYFREIIKLLH